MTGYAAHSLLTEKFVRLSYRPPNVYNHSISLRVVMEQLKLLDRNWESSGLGDVQAPSSRNRKPQGARRTFLEFFAGSGLVTEALKGLFLPVWANDNSDKKSAVYTANHGRNHFHCLSIADVRGDSLPQAELAWASFPCQDLSLAGSSAGIHGARSGLVWEWLRVIDEMRKRPPILVAENVPGLVSSADGAHYRTLHRSLRKRGYRVGAMQIDAARWLPQSRPRIFVLAVDDSITVPSKLCSEDPSWLHSAAVRRATRRLDGWVWWNMPEPRARKIELKDLIERDGKFKDPEMEQRNLQLISKRHREMLNAIRGDFVAPGYKRTRHGKQVLELRFDNVAGCLRTPEGGSSRQFLVTRKNNKLRCRLLTVRETARLMGASDEYQIPGSYNDGYKAMGDAVAVPVARWLAKYLLLPLAVAAHAKTS